MWDTGLVLVYNWSTTGPSGLLVPLARLHRPHRPLLMASPWSLNSVRSGRGVTLCLNYPGTDQNKEIEYRHKHLMHRTQSNV